MQSCYPIAAIRPQTRALDPYSAFWIYDTFTGANGTAIDARSPEKGTWTNTGVIEIQNNKAKLLSLAATRGFAFSTSPVGGANGYMQTDLTIVGNGDLGVIINVQDVDHLWMVWYSLNRVYLYEQTAKETFVSRGTWAGTPTLTLKGVTNGDTIEVWVDGTLRITYTVAGRPYKSNAVSGLMIYGTVPSGSSLDNAKAGP